MLLMKVHTNTKLTLIGRRKASGKLDSPGLNAEEQIIASTLGRQQVANQIFLHDLSSIITSHDMTTGHARQRSIETSRRQYKPTDYGFMGKRSTFPLSLDHLIPLIQYNLVRACVTNATILSLLHAVPFHCNGMWDSLPLFSPPVILPESLAPTDLLNPMNPDQT